MTLTIRTNNIFSPEIQNKDKAGCQFRSSPFKPLIFPILHLRLTDGFIIVGVDMDVILNLFRFGRTPRSSHHTNEGSCFSDNLNYCYCLLIGRYIFMASYHIDEVHTMHFTERRLCLTKQSFCFLPVDN